MHRRRAYSGQFLKVDSGAAPQKGGEKDVQPVLPDIPHPLYVIRASLNKIA
jgi:hypothetical protein